MKPSSQTSNDQNCVSLSYIGLKLSKITATGRKSLLSIRAHGTHNLITILSAVGLLPFFRNYLLLNGILFDSLFAP